MSKPVFAVDVDDVVMVPRTMVYFYDALELSDSERDALASSFKQYKRGIMDHLALTVLRWGIISDHSIEKRGDAIQNVVDNISLDGRGFIESLKELGKVYLVSNSDHDMISAIAKELDVDFFAENKLVLEYFYYGVNKEQPVLDAGIKPDFSISDDPLNDAPVLDIAETGIVVKRADFKVEYPLHALEKYVFVDDLQEALDEIKKRII